MKYQELLERFWDMDKDFSSTETLLYLYLLHRCNSYGWPDTFSLSNEELIERLKCRPTNFRVARNALVDAGLIRYYVGNGRGGISSYSIEGRSDVSKKGVPTGTPFEELKEEKQEKKTFPPAPPIKEKKEKKKSAHTISAHTPMCANGQVATVVLSVVRTTTRTLTAVSPVRARTSHLRTRTRATGRVSPSGATLLRLRNSARASSENLKRASEGEPKGCSLFRLHVIISPKAKNFFVICGNLYEFPYLCTAEESNGRVVSRANNNANANGGLAYTNTNNASSNSNTNNGSRLN